MHISYFPETGAFRFFRGGEDEPWLKGKEFYSAGIAGVYTLKKNLAIEIGADFGRYTVEIDPWGNNNSYNEEIPILYIPVMLRYSFLKYAFASGGLIFGFDFSGPGELTSQSGIGITLGTGFNYEFPNGINLFINPYVNVHSLISYKYGLVNTDKIIEGSIRLGLKYRL
jgi:hypothetical protein